MALSPAGQFQIQHLLPAPADAAQLIAAVNEGGTPGVVNSSGGALQLGTNTTDVVNVVGLFKEQSSNAVTAFATGGQTNATPLTGSYNRISVCATAGDSVKLPPSAVGLAVVVTNDGAASAQVFGAGTDTINSIATATGIPLPVGAQAWFICTAAGNWRTFFPDNISIPHSKYTTAALSTTTAAAGQLTGAGTVFMNNSGANPGTYTTRTGAQMAADLPGIPIGFGFTLHLSNGQATGTLTIAAGASGVTITGTATVAGNVCRIYQVTYTAANTFVFQNIGSYTAP